MEATTEQEPEVISQTKYHIGLLVVRLDGLKRDSDKNYTGCRPPDHPVNPSRERSLAITKLEEAVMWMRADLQNLELAKH